MFGANLFEIQRKNWLVLNEWVNLNILGRKGKKAGHFQPILWSHEYSVGQSRKH